MTEPIRTALSRSPAAADEPSALATIGLVILTCQQLSPTARIDAVGAERSRATPVTTGVQVSYEEPTADAQVHDPASLFDMTGQVALITGASSGLGARAARVLSRAGAHVVLAARRTGRLAGVARSLSAATVAVCDVTDDDDVARAVTACTTECGGLDLVVSCAGIADEPDALELTSSRFAQILDVNLVGAFRVAARCAEAMRDAGTEGAIVHVSSIMARVGLGKIPSTAYAASKGGLEAMTRELAVQWAPHGIRVNCLAPGFFPSELTEELFQHERGRALVRDLTPLARTGRPADLDGPLLLLASRASSFMTGQVVVVDGGWTAR